MTRKYKQIFISFRPDNAKDQAVYDAFHKELDATGVSISELGISCLKFGLASQNRKLQSRLGRPEAHKASLALDKKLLKWLFQYRYPTYTCPKCGLVDRMHHCITRPTYYACQCSHQVSIKAATPFTHSSTPLSHWFYTTYLVKHDPHISTVRIRKSLYDNLGWSPTEKSVWYMRKKIKDMLVEDPALAEAICTRIRVTVKNQTDAD